MKALILGLVAGMLVIPTVLRQVGMRRSSPRLVLAGLAAHAILFLAILGLLCALAVRRGEAAWAIPLIGASSALGLALALLTVRRLKHRAQ